MALNAMMTDAMMLSKAAVEGKLATRADLNRHQGGLPRVVRGVNETLDAVIGPLNVAADYVDKISKAKSRQDFRQLQRRLQPYQEQSERVQSMDWRGCRRPTSSCRR